MLFNCEKETDGPFTPNKGSNVEILVKHFSFDMFCLLWASLRFSQAPDISPQVIIKRQNIKGYFRGICPPSRCFPVFCLRRFQANLSSWPFCFLWNVIEFCGSSRIFSFPGTFAHPWWYIESLPLLDVIECYFTVGSKTTTSDFPCCKDWQKWTRTTLLQIFIRHPAQNYPVDTWQIGYLLFYMFPLE